MNIIYFERDSDPVPAYGVFKFHRVAPNLLGALLTVLLDVCNNVGARYYANPESRVM